MSILDLILRCDERDLLRVVWSEDLLTELERVWVRQGARDAASARRITDSIRSTFADQEIRRSSYEQLIEEMPGPDPADHSHAAAAVALAPTVLLTANLMDFPASLLADRGVTVLSPDEYASELLVSHRDEILDIISSMSADRRRPPMAPDEVLDALARAGLSRFASDARDA